MASSSGTSSGSITQLQNSGSEGDLQLMVMDERKRRRMLSNRESARRSRMRKQKHLDGLVLQMNQLRKEKDSILAAYKLTTQQYIAVETENSVLRTQMAELSSRLQSLSEILEYMDSAAGLGYFCEAAGSQPPPTAATMVDSFMNPWGLLSVNQPIMASADMFIK